MPDLRKTMRQYVHEETADEFDGGKSHDFPTVIIPAIAPLESNTAVFYRSDTVIGDSNAVRVTPQILNDTGSGLEGRFTVHDPFLPVALINKIKELVRLPQVLLIAEEVKALRFEQVEEFAPEFTREHAHGEEEFLA